MKISYSAPAKVILSGEHTVVYGKPALVSAINLRLKFSLTILERSLLRQDFGGQACQDGKANKEIVFISQKVKDYLKNQKIIFSDRPFNYKIESKIPIGRGLGSSAALSVASVAAFLEFYTGRKLAKVIINNLAYEIEKYFHQNPSGVDNSAACFGGLILYQNQSSLKNSDYKISKVIEDNLLLIDSGKPEEKTSEMVNSVADLYSRSPKIIKKTINDIEKITKNLVSSIKNTDINLFKECLSENEKKLEEIEVVSAKTKKLLIDLSKFGNGKITGAGGSNTDSGFIIFLAEDKGKLVEFLTRRKINYYNFVPDYQGLKRL